MKFAEMPYQRVDTDAVVAGLKELTRAVCDSSKVL